MQTGNMFKKNLVLLTVLVLWPAQSPAKEYVLTVGNEQLRFVPQAEKGYVVKQAKPKAGISALAGTLFLEEGQVQPIGGLDRHGIWIVENDGPASRNDAAMAELIHNGAAEYAAPLFSSYGETVAVIPEIVIRVHPGVDARQVHFLCQSMSLAIIKPMEFTTQEYLLQVLGPDAEAVFTALENLNKVEWIEWAAPNTASQPKLCGQVIPNDQYFPRQWHLDNTGQSGGTPGADINAPEAWEITTGDPNIVIAVLDSGVDSNHPDLVNNLVPGYDFYDNDDRPDPSTDHWLNAHGTCCAGLIAARGNNGIGVAGVTWRCKIMPIRIFSVRADGTEVWTTQDDRATALRWAAANRADILSNSWCWGLNPLPIIYSGILDVTKSGGMGRDGKGCIVLFAAGNWIGPVRYPAKYPEVIAVGATDHNDLQSWYSDYGPELDIVAPGGGGVHTYDLDLFYTLSHGLLWTTDMLGLPGWNKWNSDPNTLDYAEKFSGTSAATPVAAGVAALVLSVDPNLTNTQVQYILERSAKDLGAPGRDDYYGWGRVDARAALDMVMAKRADLNNDWKVDFRDFAVLAACWNTDDLRGDIGPIPRPDGAVDVQDLALMGEYWLKEIPDPRQAWGPTPADGATNQPKSILYWNAGETANAHDVYFDTDRTAVENADTSSPLYIDHVVETPGVQPCSTKAVTLQQASTTYYWRIDEVEADGVTIHKGDVWSFTVMPLTAWDPSPTNGQTLVSTAPTLYWNQGADAITSVVYFGTSSNSLSYKKVINHTPGQLRYNWPVTPTPLAYNTTYYWRIDQRDPNNAVHKGDVWSFTTVPNIPITDPTLLGWWKLDKGSGTTVLDWSGHNRHGTINGGATYATGVFDKALILGGIDDWVSVGNRILYVDGVEVARDTQDAVAPSGGGLHIRAGKNLETGTFWSGPLDDIRIYDRAVTP
jgi:subtilisin family serine protease